VKCRNMVIVPPGMDVRRRGLWAADAPEHFVV
jgi:hypothetical protein